MKRSLRCIIVSFPSPESQPGHLAPGSAEDLPRLPGQVPGGHRPGQTSVLLLQNGVPQPDGGGERADGQQGPEGRLHLHLRHLRWDESAAASGLQILRITLRFYSPLQATCPVKPASPCTACWSLTTSTAPGTPKAEPRKSPIT